MSDESDMLLGVYRSARAQVEMTRDDRQNPYQAPLGRLTELEPSVLGELRTLEEVRSIAVNLQWLSRFVVGKLLIWCLTILVGRIEDVVLRFLAACALILPFLAAWLGAAIFSFRLGYDLDRLLGLGLALLSCYPGLGLAATLILVLRAGAVLRLYGFKPSLTGTTVAQIDALIEEQRRGKPPAKP